MKLTNEEKDILLNALRRLEEFYGDQEKIVRKFKHICEVPASGKEYEENKNTGGANHNN